MKRVRIFSLLCIAVIVSGCASTTTIKAVQENATIRVRDEPSRALPYTGKYRTTTFGKYEFKASQAGDDAMYGILPLKLNVGYMIMDALIFGPGALFNLRGVYPEYEFDLDNRVIRFRKSLADPWREYQPKESEADRARRYYGDL